jgi:hypothetical protein
MEYGLDKTFSKTDNATVITIGKLNIAKLARVLLKMNDGISRKPLKDDLEHGSRLEDFKQYPKGTRAKHNGEITKGS